MQVTLRTLVLDLLAESGVTIIEPTTTITTKFICSAVERTTRQINKPAILSNLGMLLSKEVECGNFSKVGEEMYRLPPNGTPYQPPTPPPPSMVPQNGPMIVPTSTLTPQGTYMATPPPPPLTVHSNTHGFTIIDAPKTPLSPSMTSMPPPQVPQSTRSQTGMPQSPCLPPMTSLTPPPAPMTYHDPNLSHHPPLNTSNNTLTITAVTKSDEERKNDLINEKLFKLTSKMSTHGKKVPAYQFHLTLRDLKAGKTRKAKSLDGPSGFQGMAVQSNIKLELTDNENQKKPFPGSNDVNGITSRDLKVSD